MNRDLLLADLERDEGYRPLMYDDKSGKQWVRGAPILGNPTIAIGWNVAGKPISLERSRIILGWFADDSWAELQAALPWVSSLDDIRQTALTEMCFNMGAGELLKFNTFLSLMQSGQYEAAAQDLETGTAWWKQAGQRGPRIQALIKGAEV